MHNEVYITANGRSMDYFDYLEMKSEIEQEKMQSVIVAPTKKTTFLGKLWQWLNT